MVEGNFSSLEFCLRLILSFIFATPISRDVANVIDLNLNLNFNVEDKKCRKLCIQSLHSLFCLLYSIAIIASFF